MPGIHHAEVRDRTMSKELLTPIVVGLIGAVIAPLVAQVAVPWVRRLIRLDPASAPAEKKRRRPSRRGRGMLVAAAVGGLVGVAVGYFAILPIASSPCAPLAPTAVQLAAIAPGSTAHRLATVHGSSCHIPRESELWLLVVPEGLTAYYLQPGPIIPTESGSWSASVYLGSEGSVDAGKTFLVIAAIADKDGAAALRSHLARPGSETAGIEPLPPGVQMMSEVRIVRR
jgi:hypothetical protein